MEALREQKRDLMTLRKNYNFHSFYDDDYYDCCCYCCFCHCCYSYYCYSLFIIYYFFIYFTFCFVGTVVIITLATFLKRKLGGDGRKQRKRRRKRRKGGKERSQYERSMSKNIESEKRYESN